MKKFLGIMVLGLLLHGCVTPEQTYSTLKPNSALAKASSGAFGMTEAAKDIEYAVFGALASCDHYDTGCVLIMINGARVTSKEASDWRDDYNRNKKYLTIGLGKRGGFVVTSDTGERDKKPKKIVKIPKKKKPKKQTPDDNKVVAAASGTGFFISNTGHIVTNHHVIDQCKVVKVNFKGNEVEAKVLAIDKTNDLAVLKANINPSKVYSISNNDVSLLEDIIVAGFPLGKNVSSAIKTHKGSVTALAGFGDNYSNFQTDATINQGNSGGPVMDHKGNIVGVAVALMSVEAGQNIFFAVKSSTLKTFASSNDITFLPPNNRPMSNKDLGQLITEGTVFLECWMTVAKIKQIIAQEENRKAFYSKFK